MCVNWTNCYYVTHVIDFSEGICHDTFDEVAESSFLSPNFFCRLSYERFGCRCTSRWQDY